MSIWPFWRALSAIAEEPRSSFVSTLKPFAASAWAYSSPRTYCSVKFLEPTVIVGPPPPLSSPALGPEPLLPTLPQPAMASSASAASRAGMARVSFDLFFTLPPLPSCLTSALLRDLQPLGGHGPLQRAEADLRDDGQGRNRERTGEQYGRVVELGALHDQFPKTAAPDKRR